jgi:membrane dipeptidase
MTHPVVDAHSDLLLELTLRSTEERPFERHYLDALRAGSVAVQVCAISTLPAHLPERALRVGLQQALAFRRALRENPDATLGVRGGDDLDAVGDDGRIGLLLAFEGVDALGVDADLFELFWDLGVRMVGLTWSSRNAFADGDAEPAGGGLSVLGRRLVARLAELGVVIDLAHAGEGTFRDVLAQAPEAPIVVSHGSCRALIDMPRATSDEQLRLLAERDGVIGIVAAPPLLDRTGNTSIERMVDHIDHVAQLVGVRHVGVGSDFFVQLYASGALQPKDVGLSPDSRMWAAMSHAMDGLEGPAQLPALAAALALRGYADADVAAVLGGNFLRVLRRLP